MSTVSVEKQHPTEHVAAVDRSQPLEGGENASSILSKLEAVLSEDPDAIDSLVNDEIAAVMSGAQNRKWAEMIAEFTDQPAGEFVVDVKGGEQDSF